MKKYILPPLVLTIICIIVSALLVGAYKLTYVDTTGVMTDELKTGCSEIFGDDEFNIIMEDKTPITFNNEKINSIIKNKTSDKIVFEITDDGYNKGGIHILIGLDKDGVVKGVTYVSCTETPGLGTKTDDPEYLAKYKGFKNGDNIDDIDNITGATYSSKGVKSAIKIATKTFTDNKEAILSE